MQQSPRGVKRTYEQFKQGQESPDAQVGTLNKIKYSTSGEETKEINCAKEI